jgi:branched-chain amino acid aminotransferase
VDRIQVGEGKAGPVTQKIQQRFMDIVRGKTPDVYGWLDRAPRASAVAR